MVSKIIGQEVINLAKTVKASSVGKISQEFATSPVKKAVNDTFQRVIRQADNTGLVFRKVVDKVTGKITKIPERIFVEQKGGGFIFRNSKNEIIGGVKLELYKNLNTEGLIGLFKDMPEYGIVGDRVVIKTVDNIRQEEYSGIAKLADQIAVEYCLKNKIKPNIVFDAAYNSHAAHYLRGMKFIPFSDGAQISKIFKEDFGTSNPNKIVEKIIRNTPQGQHCDTSALGMLKAYMPKEVVEKYLQEIKYNPVLK